MGAYAPATEKYILMCQKISNKTLVRTSRHSLWVQEVSRKTDIFCDMHKKGKKKYSRKPFLEPKFVVFTYDTKNVGFP